MDYLIGIDIGTTGTKTLLIDDSGKVMASATYEYPLHTPKPLWAEQDPADWWQATVSSIREVFNRCGVSPSDIKGIGLSGQMHGAVLLDAHNEVLRPAILWCDQRTGEQCEWITREAGESVVVEETCNPVLTGFTAPKIVWVKQNEPEIYSRVRKILLPKDYVRFRLTGEFATEVSDASGTSLLNVRERRWSQKMLAAVGITEDMLPTVFESPEVSGRITAEVAHDTLLAEGTPVVGGGGDQAAGGVGNGIVEPGVVSSTTGTSGVVFAYMDEPITDPQLRTHTFCHAVPGKWHVMGVMLSAGGSLRWFRDALGQPEKEEAARRAVDPYEVLLEPAAEVEPGCEGLIFLPYLTGERTPYPDPDARGAFFGLTLRHTKAHLTRSVLEGVAYGLRDSFEILREMGLPIEQVRASGGGARSALWRQIQADVAGAELVTINVDEGPAFGVALLAGVGAGIYPSVQDACARTIRVQERTAVDRGRVAVYARYYPIYRALYQSLKSQFKAVSQAVSAS
ncbi:xylulose kinase [candidate division KD3-62 bacterium DG_56]|uniref:Xylulose kinase n=1 Tax=candidate division KD3-62 bacterium DG_56 TaxID=1704032 RepID=A0A0S7XN21_9BACT|nr:MAG: xylulose kinase [candidate division KD3-62 bacterium DG_56]